MLACLGSALSSANSPKQSPTLQLKTSAGSESLESCLTATAVPFSTKKNLSPYSPCLTTYSPLAYHWVLRESESYPFSKVSIVESNSILANRSLYCSLLLMAASFTMLLKVSLSNLNSTQFDLQITLAALGALQSRASSPKASPYW